MRDSLDIAMTKERSVAFVKFFYSSPKGFFSNPGTDTFSSITILPSNDLDRLQIFGLAKTFLIWLKDFCYLYLKLLSFFSHLFRPLGLFTEAFQLSILEAFIILSVLIIIVNSCFIFVFNIWVFSNKFNLFQVTCSITIFLIWCCALCAIRHLCDPTFVQL